MFRLIQSFYGINGTQYDCPCVNIAVLFQMYGHLHGHAQHLHAAGDDSSQRRREQKEVATRRQEDTTLTGGEGFS